MRYRTRQTIAAVIVAIVAVIVASFSGPGPVAALPLSALIAGWPFARLALLPARRRFLAESAAGATPERRASWPMLIGVAVGFAAPAVLSQFSGWVAAAVIGQYLAGLAGAIFFLSRWETQ